MTFDGIGGNGWLTIANFIGKVPCKNIVVKNIIGTIEFKNWNCTKFDGSLHLENIGDLAAADWTVGQGGLDKLEEVTGDLTVKNVKKMGAYTFINLKKVGGNLTIVQAIGTSNNLAEDMCNEAERLAIPRLKNNICEDCIVGIEIDYEMPYDAKHDVEEWG